MQSQDRALQYSASRGNLGDDGDVHVEDLVIIDSFSHNTSRTDGIATDIERCGLSCSALIMVLIYSPDGSNVYDARGEEFEGMGSVYRGLGLNGVKSCSSYLLVQTLAAGCTVYPQRAVASQTDGQTDRQMTLSGQ